MRSTKDPSQQDAPSIPHRAKRLRQSCFVSAWAPSRQAVKGPAPDSKQPSLLRHTGAQKADILRPKLMRLGMVAPPLAAELVAVQPRHRKQNAHRSHVRRPRENPTQDKWPWVKSQIVPPVNIPIPTKIGSKRGGAPIPTWDHRSQMELEGFVRDLLERTRPSPTA